ncbi:GNAT family N-acetyltransferase [Vibrio aestuarianus]|uniref:GNAT family N-acetyltransferase n=1 Tax=Vibrio aestuarianus TaxID=28171 RepID=UPI001558F09E|nr:GNAT family N-acetyltransferase [Vibrio aestuarianus]NGZ13232.1 GNAT family N-acetyltransferase [Vibrio aestuarianus]NKZ49380.1 GNAT family N-acetyltransferase [Vibrio aestuarianus]
MYVTTATRRTLLLPYTDSLESDFLMLNCCAKNRAQMNGPKTVASAKQLFQRVLHDPNLYAMAVLDGYNREYMGHIFVELEEGGAELGFLFDKMYWGKGIATEALKAFVPTACHQLQLSRLKAMVNIDHRASIEVLKKIGFTLKGEKEDIFGPYFVFEFTSDVAVNERLMV